MSSPIGIEVEVAQKLVSFGNAFLLGRYDGDGGVRSRLVPGVAGWSFQTWQPRQRGILPIRPIAWSPYGWFRWLRANACSRLALVALNAADIGLLDGPVTAFSAMAPGCFVLSEQSPRAMLWDAWKVTPSFFRPREKRVEYRGVDVFATPPRADADLGAIAARFDAMLEETIALAPAERTVFETARTALHAANPEALVDPRLLPMLAPSTHPSLARRLSAAALVASSRPRFTVDDGELPRPDAFETTILAARCAAVNALS